MTSFPSNEHDYDADLFSLDPKDEAVTHFVTLVGRQLQDAFLQRKAEDGLTQQKLAALIGVDRSRIHRCLSGYSNLTLESVAELAWALKGTPNFSLNLDRGPEHGCNYRSKDVIPDGVIINENDGVTLIQTLCPRSPGSRTSVYKVHRAYEDS